MAISTKNTTLAASYRYFVCDLVTNELLSEIPFKNVTYGRSIREAGSFTGDIAITPDTENLGLYENTLPGKTALYVVRDNVCVWGGIIWSRSYDIKNKILNVSGSEFTSYLYHRVAWKTWGNEYPATVSVEGTSGKIVLQSGHTFDFQANQPIYITFDSKSTNTKYNDYYYIKSSPSPTDTTAYFSSSNSGIVPPGISQDQNATVTVRQDTYEYARDLIKALELDFYGPIFENSELEPSAIFTQNVSSISRTSNVATIKFLEQHYLVPGQGITLRNVSTEYDGRYLVKSVVDGTTITVDKTGTNHSAITYSSLEYDISKFARTKSGKAIITLATSHSLSVGDVVEIFGINANFDGTYTLTEVTSTTISYETEFVTAISSSTAPEGAMVKKGPEARFTSYGEYTLSSGLDVLYSTEDLSSQSPKKNLEIRGADLKYVGEILEEYSNVPGGFEYRIDCAFDSETNSFTRTFVFLPLEPNSLRTYKNSLTNKKLPAGKYAPLSAFNATQIVFEHPGNVLNATMVESAEDAATRFWVQGDDDTDNADSSLPYAAETDVALLEDGWPLLDGVEKIDNVSEESILYEEYATRFLAESTPPISSFSISVDGSIRPQIGTYKPGDWCSVIIDDQFVQLRLLSALEPGSTQADREGILLRKIDAFEVSIPDSPTIPEEVSITLVTEPDIDRAGLSVVSLTENTLAKTSSSVELQVVVDLELEENIAITLYRGATLVDSWNLTPSSSVIGEAVTVSGLSASTTYTFSLKIDGENAVTISARTASA